MAAPARAAEPIATIPAIETLPNTVEAALLPEDELPDPVEPGADDEPVLEAAALLLLAARAVMLACETAEVELGALA